MPSDNGCVGCIATRPCKQRKDGAPAVLVMVTRSKARATRLSCVSELTFAYSCRAEAHERTVQFVSPHPEIQRHNFGRNSTENRVASSEPRESRRMSSARALHRLYDRRPESNLGNLFARGPHLCATATVAGGVAQLIWLSENVVGAPSFAHSAKGGNHELMRNGFVPSPCYSRPPSS